jgi:hypothetical protein
MMLRPVDRLGFTSPQRGGESDSLSEQREIESPLSFLRIKILRGETLIIHCCAGGQLEIRRLASGILGAPRSQNIPHVARSTGSRTPGTRIILGEGVLNTPAQLNTSAKPSLALQAAAPAARPINDVEFDELAALRKAQSWETPIFQPGHPNYHRTVARLAELEAKERAACDSSASGNQHSRISPRPKRYVLLKSN